MNIGKAIGFEPQPIGFGSDTGGISPPSIPPTAAIGFPTIVQSQSLAPVPVPPPLRTIARPNQDITRGNWRRRDGAMVNLHELLGGDLPGNDYVQSGSLPSGDVYEVKFEPLSPPNGRSRYLRYHYRKRGTQPMSVTVALVEGAAVKQTWLHTNVTTSFYSAVQLITASISDWSDVRLRVTATIEQPLPPSEFQILTVDFNVGATVYTATSSGALGNDLWLDGGLVRDGRQTLVPMNGPTPHPTLRVVLDTRDYGNGDVRYDVCVENCLDVAEMNAFTYDVTIKLDAVTVFSQPAVVQSAFTRWRKKFGFQPIAVDNANLLINSKAFQDIDESIVTSGWTYDPGLSKWDILQTGDWQPAMGSTGGRHEIAPQPSWVARWLAQRDIGAYQATLHNGEQAGAWSSHFREPADGSFHSLDARPDYYFWPNWQGLFYLDGPANNLATGQSDNLSISADRAHQGSMATAPYLMTGDRFYADEMAFWANYCLFSHSPSFNERGTPPSLGWFNSPTARSTAWSLRNLLHAAVFLPTSHQLKALFNTKLQNNFTMFDGKSTSRMAILFYPEAGRSPNDPNKMYAPPWQYDFVASTLIHCLALGLGGSTSWLNAYAQLRVDMASNDEGWYRTEAYPFQLPVSQISPSVQYTSLNQSWVDGLGNPTPLSEDPAPSLDHGNFTFSDYAKQVLQYAIAQSMPRAQAALDYALPYMNRKHVTAGWSGWFYRYPWTSKPQTVTVSQAGWATFPVVYDSDQTWPKSVEGVTTQCNDKTPRMAILTCNFPAAGTYNIV